MPAPATQHVEESPVAARFAFASGARPLPGYTIKRGIGRGGFGEVYYAVSDAGKEVALKLVCRNLDIELRGVTQCLNLKHPNLLALFDIRQDDTGESWVVMEYVAGDSLERVIDRNPNGMPLDQVLFWMQGIAAGVGYLHHHGIVHRDLKPGNVFCDEGMVKVGDYGLSKFMSCSRRSGQTGSIGTVHYMAPEVANGRYGREIDIYALGIMLYEMITGRVPFDGESLGEILMKHLTAQPDLRGIAEPCRTAIARALSKDPDKRPHSVAEFMALLPRTANEVSASAALPPAPVALNTGFASPRLAPLPEMPMHGVEPSKPITATGETALTAIAVEMTHDAEPIGPPNDAGWTSPWARVQRQWTRWDRFQRIFVVVCVGIAALTVAEKLMPRGAFNFSFNLVGCAIMAYGAFWFFRYVLATDPPLRSTGGAPRMAVGGAAAPSPAPPVIAKYVGPGKQTSFWQPWHRGQSPTLPPVGTPRQRAAELLGSMLFGAVVAGIVALVLVIFRGANSDGGPIEPNQYAWLTLSAILAAWSIMIPAKLWEGQIYEPALRRFFMLVVGLGVGLAAYGIYAALFVRLNTSLHDEHFRAIIDDYRGSALGRFFAPDGSPLLPAFLAYFGVLWLIQRWWRLADRLRPRRFTFWLTAGACFWSMVASLLTHFPVGWGLMLALTVAITVQLASPWTAQPPRVPRSPLGPRR